MLNESNIPLEEDGIEEEILVDEEVAITKAMWGDVGGNIENQTDLQNALDAKQDSLTEAQLNAVNSGITSEKVTTYDGYADQIASKADQSALNAESVARGEADMALGTRIDNEALARQQTDNGLQSQIDAITSKSDVVDVVANYAALQAYDTSTLGNNDVVKVLDDETHEDALTYYRWSTTTQTWTYIGQEAPYYSKGQMDVKLAEKQDKLTAGANIQIQNGTISATDTTYTAGNGLNLNGTEFSADTDVLATKEDLEGYYTKTEADNLLAPKLEAEVVAELPTTGTEGKLYLTPKTHTTQTASGNPITATVTEQAGQLESFQLDGDTFQQSYTGKNLLNVEGKWSITAGAGVTVTDGADGSLILNGTVTAREDIRLYSSSDRFTLESGKTVTMSRAPYSNWNLIWHRFTSESGTGTSDIKYFDPGASSFTYTTLDTDYGYQFIMRLPVGTTFNNTHVYLQLEESASPTSYEPYVGGQPSPSPSYPQPIQTVTGRQVVEVRGKNLFDETATPWYSGRAYDGNGELAYWSGYVAIVAYQSVEPNTTYTFSNSAGKAIYYGLVFYDEYKNKISFVTASTRTFTTPANCAYIRFAIQGSTAPTWTQLELGSTATDYAPYSKQTYPIDLGTIELCKLGTYQDYIWKDGDDWKVHKATGKKVLNGSESYTRFASSNIVRFIAFIDGSINTTTRSDLFRATHFHYLGTGDEVGGAFLNASNIGLMYGTNDESVDQFKEWLRSNNVTLDFALATPTDTTITDTNLIAQLEAIRTAALESGSNTISNTATGTNLAGDMEIGYYGFNPTNRYDKFIWLDLNNNYEQIGGE